MSSLIYKSLKVVKKYKNIHQKLIDDCRQGKTQSQFEIYKLYYKAMYNTSLRLVNDSAEAEDIMQEAFLSAFKNINNYKEEVSFGAWLKKIVVNRSLDSLKKRKIQQDPIDDRVLTIEEDDDDNKLNVNDIAQEVAEVKQAIALLPQNYKTLITLHLIEGYDHDEVAEILEMTNAAVRTGYSRARKKLQELLKQKKTGIWMN